MNRSRLTKTTIKISSFSVLAVSHVVAAVFIVYLFMPIATWYLNIRPILGVDTFLTVNLATVLRDNFAPPYAFWNYGWFGGWPQFTYPFLTIYLASFLSKTYGIVQGAQMVALGSAALFVLGSYFLFYRASKNVVIALILATFTTLSGGVYQALTWAGSIPSFSSQAAFPWALGFWVWFLREGKYRYFFTSVLVSGISIFTHPLVFMTYIFPAVAILTVFKFDHGLQIFKKVRDLFLFVAVVLLIGLPQFVSTFGVAIKSVIKPSTTTSALSTTKAPNQMELDIAKFNQDQVNRILSDNNEAIFLVSAVLFVLFIATVLGSRKIKSVFSVLPYGLLVAYFTFYIWLFGQGISIFHGGWYRLFWSVPIWIGLLGASSWFFAYENVRQITKNIYIRLMFFAVATSTVTFLGFVYYQRFPVTSTINMVSYRSQESSAHPDLLNYRPSDFEIASYRDKLRVSWFDPDETNFRMYDPDQTVNIWFNSIFKMPLARGYLDPPIDDAKRGYIFWLDAALSVTDGEPQLVKVFSYPLETAISNALFLVDWNGIKYYEGGHTSPTSNGSVPNYLSKLLVDKDEEFDFNDLKYISRKRTLHYFRFKDDITSPILAATNASTIGIFGTEGGYESVIRSIAERDNINSRRLIPINLGQKIDKYNLESLNAFDALYLYDYDYADFNKTFSLLDKYVKRGKKIFVETGVEVKQSSGNLSDLFPVKAVERKGLGREWLLEGQGQFANGIDFGKFSAPIFDDDEWNISYAKESDLRTGANAILKHKGNVIMASQKIGAGEVFWSGMNLAYHISRNHNQEEAKFFDNMLGTIVDISSKPLPNSQVNFVNANKRLITFEKARGILFKEQAYDGWQAKYLSGGSGGLKIYKAGPAYPGYMYMPLQKGESGKVEINFSGSLAHRIQIYVTLAVVVLIVDEVVLSGLVLGRARRWAWSFARKRTKGWWEKEDE